MRKGVNICAAIDTTMLFFSISSLNIFSKSRSIYVDNIGCTDSST